jgi:hypothetical protein
MDKAAEKLGCRQSYLSQIETAKTKQRKTKTGETRTDKVFPNLDFLMKTMDVYGLNSAEKTGFSFQGTHGHRQNRDTAKRQFIPGKDPSPGNIIR